MADAKQEIWWVLRAQAGDREALDALLSTVQEPLYRYIASLAGQQSLAEDILQDVFFLIYRKLRWLREPELFRAWAYRIATRETFRQLRHERRWSAQVRDDEVLAAIPAPQPEPFEPELVAQLPQLIANIPPGSRAVIVLHYLHEMSIEETAAVLGIAVGTAKSRLAYGLSGLRQRLRKL